MLVPKLFRWLFFKKVGVTNVFDALRNKDALIVDVCLDLGAKTEVIENAIQLNDDNFDNFINTTHKDSIIVLVGNHKQRRMKFYDQLEQHNFKHLFDLGTVEDYRTLKKSI